MQRPQQGFNLVELMFTLVIMAILVGVALPSFDTMLDRRAVESQANRLARSLNLARSKAVTGGNLVTVERLSGSSSDWSKGWRVYVDSSAGGSYNASSDDLISTISIDTRDVSLINKAGAADRVTFDARGQQNGATPVKVEFSVCDKAKNDKIDGSKVIVGTTGRVYLETIDATAKASKC